MNESDSEIVAGILHKAGLQPVTSSDDADIVLVNTCSIREKAEIKVKQRLNELNKAGAKIAVLGCMAERLKESLFEEKLADIVVGPDGYRSLPRLIEAVLLKGQSNAIDVQLSAEETYADVAPVRSNGISAYLSIMRGCNNMCSFCVVPFTRGRERSRPLQSILEEVKNLNDTGIKELTLLGQNVNSYYDPTSTFSDGHQNTKGFQELYKIRDGSGARFHNLLESVATVAPNMRIRFTSPHPKDFPPLLLQTIKNHPNICNHIHLPLQSGSNKILNSMRRYYTQEAYLRLVDDIRENIDNVSISTDIIAGFCGEEEEDHLETLKVAEKVKFEQAFMFMYSMRGKTYAFNNMKDDVEESVKRRRLEEIIQLVKSGQHEKNQNEIGKRYDVLVEGPDKKGGFTGRTTHNKRVAGQGKVEAGEIVSVKIIKATSQTLIAENS